MQVRRLLKESVKKDLTTGQIVDVLVNAGIKTPHGKRVNSIFVLNQLNLLRKNGGKLRTRRRKRRNKKTVVGQVVQKHTGLNRAFETVVLNNPFLSDKQVRTILIAVREG